MENWGQRKTLINLFWKIFPVILTAIFIFPILRIEIRDSIGRYFFLLMVVLCVFPFSIAASLFVRMIIIAKRIQPHCFRAAPYAERKRRGEELLQNPRYAELARKASKWGQISMLIWIVVFLIIAAIAIHFIRIERSEPHWQIVKYPQPQAISEGSAKHELLCTLNTVIHYLFFMPFIALTLGVVILIRSLLLKNKERKRKDIFWKGLPFVAVACFIIPILLVFALGGLVKKIVRDEVKGFLNNVSPDVIVKVEGQQIENPNQIITELSKVATLPAHHTHATKRIRIEVINNNDGLVVDLSRDSQCHQEYWVFYLGYGHTYVNEIGRITTNLFDGY